jgi:preprotein translocase subunit SecE
MASKSAIVNGEERPAPIKRQASGGSGGGGIQNISGSVVGFWERFTSFLSDVRAETRKVVAPSRKEVQATTSVVLITVFVFGVFFMVTDFVFNRVISQILHKLGGAQ